MVGARSGEQQRFGLQRPPLARRCQKQGADRFGTRRTARFARQLDLMALFAQVLGKQARLGGFAHALPALEGDECPAGQVTQLRMALKTRWSRVASSTSSLATSGTRWSGIPSIETINSATSSPLAIGACNGPS